MIRRPARWLTGCAIAIAAGGCGQQPPAPPSAPPAAERNWTAEDITQDPGGYLKWADQKVARQMTDRENRLQRVNARLAEIELKRKAFTDNLDSVRRLNTYMKKAIQKAEDEDRWPVVVGGQSFDAARAKLVVEQTARYDEDRRAMANDYDQAVARMETAAVSLKKDQEQLRRLREKIALDLERIRVNQGVEELATLRQTEGEISSFAQALSQMTDESLLSVPLVSEEEKARLEVDSFLQKKK